jgi:DTW domain-containing protein
MDKATYLKIKQEQNAAQVSYKKEKTCYRCFWLEENCRCPLIKPFATDTRFVILMHPMEAKKEKLGTGRITHATLLNSEIIMGINFTQDKQVNALIADPQNYCMVLYPGEKSVNISTDDISPLIETKKLGQRLVVFLIDGTWPCAKKMMTQSLNIRNLPRISFTATHESIFQIKEQPAEYCLSTLESIHFFLDEAHRRGLEHLPEKPQDNLITVFKSMIDFMLMCALDPNRSTYRKVKTGYTTKEERRKRKKWVSRGIVLRD